MSLSHYMSWVSDQFTRNGTGRHRNEDAHVGQHGKKSSSDTHSFPLPGREDPLNGSREIEGLVENKSARARDTSKTRTHTKERMSVLKDVKFPKRSGGTVRRESTIVVKERDLMAAADLTNIQDTSVTEGGEFSNDGLARLKDELARTERELEKNKGHIGRLEGQLVQSEGEIAMKSRELEEKESELKVKQNELIELKEESQKHCQILEEMEKLQENCIELIEARDAQLRLIQQDSAMARDKLAQSVARESALNSDIEALRKERSSMAALLQTRTAELHDAQAYLTRPDTLAHGDVIRLVENLNAEIYQVAAQVADELEDAERRQIPQEVVEDAMHRARWYIGMKLTTLLRQGQDPTCVQIAMQACMTQYAGFLIMNWVPESSDILEKVFKDLYACILQSESQSVAGRWRALTRYNLKKLASNQDAITKIKDELVEHLTDILIIGGFTETREIQWQPYEDKLTTIIRLCVALQKAIGEDVVSHDLQIFVPAIDEAFTAAIMEDAYPISKNIEDGPCASSGETRVLCPVELGLQRLEKDSAGGVDEWHKSIVLKPKVALESLTQEFK